MKKKEEIHFLLLSQLVTKDVRGHPLEREFAHRTIFPKFFLRQFHRDKFAIPIEASHLLLVSDLSLTYSRPF